MNLLFWQRTQPPLADDGIAPAPANAVPPLLIPLMALVGWGLVGDTPQWATLTIAGIGMGMILFMASSGLTLVFGLMQVMNFGHAVFFTLGAFIGGLLLWPNAFLLTYFGFWVDNIVVNILSLVSAGVLGMIAAAYAATDPWLNLAALLAASLLMLCVCLPIGLLFERFIIRPAGSSTLTQVMMTVAGMVVIYEMIIATLGRGTYIRPMPAFSGAIVFGDIAIEKLRLLMIALGLLTWGLLTWLLKGTRIGLLVRATVENREQVEALGYRTRRLMLGIFSLGVALGALGGLVWAIYQRSAGINLGNSLMPLMFMVLMIGGLGSMTGTLIAALLLGLLNNYVAFSFPVFTAFSGILLALAVISWRPQGLYPLSRA